MPAAHCPVICHGLISASHLNGELGVARDVKEIETGIRLVVNFEKTKGVKSALVKPENLRILHLSYQATIRQLYSSYA